jgi:hypothetical protein
VKSGTFGVSFQVMINLPDEQMKMMWAARWVDQGCPCVSFESIQYASLLMATDVKPDLLDKVVVPWRSFYIEMPPKLLSTEDSEGVLQPIQKVLVQYTDDNFNIVALAENGLQLWTHGVKLEELTTRHVMEGRDWGYGQKCDSRDDRVLHMLGKLIISICVAMSDPDNYQERKAKNKSKGRRRNNKGLPELTAFILGRPQLSKIDCTPAIHDFIEGKAKSGPKVQYLVRGHWKHQPYGPGRSLRKLIQIEPYWKGPEDAPILTRSSRLKGG